jgi:urease accessory protein
MNRISFQKAGSLALLVAVAIVLGPRTAYAHTGVGPVHDLLHGLRHPLTGVDHICAMLAVGLWAAQRRGRAIWVIPLTFVLVMILGGMLGMSGIRLPFVEQGILLSVVVLGLLVTAAIQLPLAASAFIVGLFALLHGHAHGTELAASMSAMSYALGFVVATALLHTIGISVGLLTQRLHTAQLTQSPFIPSAARR